MNALIIAVICYQLRRLSPMRVGTIRRHVLHVLAWSVAFGTIADQTQGQGYEDTLEQLNAAEQEGRHADAAQLLERLHAMTGFDVAALYLAGASWARAGELDAAFRDLRAAVEMGFYHVKEMQRDSSLRALHADPRWLQLVGEAERRWALYDHALREELLALAKQDQRNRVGIDSIFNRYGAGSPQVDSANARLSAADAPLLTRVKEIIAERGWPSRRLVADDGANAAWLIVQHAPVEYQRQVLHLLQAAVQSGEAKASDAALLEDRVLVADGKPQLYGSQMRWPEGVGDAPVLEPIADEACVDRRRASVGLMPLADYLRPFGVVYAGPPGVCPE